MKTSLKVSIVFISFLLLIFSIFPNFSLALDIGEYWKYAQNLADNGIINNSSDYKINQNITRREMLKVMLNISKDSIDAKCVQTFSDLPSSDWWCKYAQTALKLWYIANNKTFRPDDFVSKAETLKMIFKAKKINVTSWIDWRASYVKKAVELWFIDNFSDYDSKALRGFVFKVWNNSLKYSLWSDLMCAQVITYAKSASWECIEFPNSCIPEGYTKTDKCETKLNYTKSNLVLNFASPMIKSSVESNLKIYPQLKYSTSWSDEKTLNLVVDDMINKETDVLVNVLDNALDVTNQKLEKTVSKTFKVLWDATLDFITPEWKLTTNNQDIVVKFSKPIVSLTNVDNQKTCPIIITPNLVWKCNWITTSSFKFTPEKWFPSWARYTVLVPSGIETIWWQKTLNSKVIEIVTPDFKLLWKNTPVSIKDKLEFIFNDEVNLNDFISNFSLSTYSNSNLKFEYFSDVNWIDKKIITVIPNSWDWWYDKTLTYWINKLLKSNLWNMSMLRQENWSFETPKFLLWYNSIKFNDEKSKDLYNNENIITSNNSNIILPNNPKILLYFSEEIPLDKTLFQSDLDFDLNYVNINDYTNWKVTTQDKKRILVSFKWTNLTNATLKILVSKISSSKDISLIFKTKNLNNIISYKQIDYKKACLVTDWYFNSQDRNLEKFVFDKFWKVNYLSIIWDYYNDENCKKVDWKNVYVVWTVLNPNSTYTLNISKDFSDSDFYWLNNDYKTTFTTPKALNEDKNVSIVNANEINLVPSSFSWVNTTISTINLDRVYVNVCQWDFDVTSSNYMKNTECNWKSISVKNLWFKPNLSVLSLENIFWKIFEKKFIYFEVSKLKEDKTEYELKWYLNNIKTSYLISDINATLKSWENNVLWLRDFNLWQNLDNQVEKIESYKSNSNYSVFGQYLWIKKEFDKNITFKFIKDWMYYFDWTNIYWDLLITLKSWEKVYLPNIYYEKSQDVNKNYISTSKPIYKPWETVEISWISANYSYLWYLINAWDLNITITDQNYKTLVSQKIKPNLFWSFKYSFTLPNDAVLWNYSLNVWWAYKNFMVANYVKPDFKIQATSNKQNYVFGESALVSVLWDYYAWGLGLANAKVSYNLQATRYYFDWGKTTWYQFWEEFWYWWRDYDLWYEQSYLNSGVEYLDNFWKKTIDIKLDLETKTDKNYTLNIDVQDPNTQKTISKSINFVWTKSDVFLWIKTDKYFYNYNDEAKLWFVTTDILGNKVWNKDFKLDIFKVNYKLWNSYNLDKDEKIIKTQNLKTLENWMLDFNYKFEDYWEYRFEITLNNWYKTSKTIYVSGWNILLPNLEENKVQIASDKETYNVWDKMNVSISSPIVWVKALVTVEKNNWILYSQIVDITNNSQNVLLDVKKEYLPVFRVKVFILKDMSVNTENIEKLRILREKMVELEQKLTQENSWIIFPYMIKDLTFINYSSEVLDKDLLKQYAAYKDEEIALLNELLPSYYVWEKKLNVNTDFVKLNAKITLDKQNYKPWDNQKIDLFITDKSWSWITWNLTLKLIDSSLLDLSDNDEDIMKYFYSNEDDLVSTNTNLKNLIKRIDFLRVNKDNLLENALSVSNTIRWATTEDLSLWDSFWTSSDNLDLWWIFWAWWKATWTVSKTTQDTDKVQIRWEWKDLAYYKTQIDVVNWKASININGLPDNLTTWKILWYSQTKNMEVWSFLKEFKVQKELSIVPSIPSFMVIWDKIELWATVLNSSNKDLSVNLSITWTNLDILESQKTIELKAWSSSFVWFDVNVKWLKNEDDIKNFYSKITIIAKSWIYNDWIERNVKIYYPSTKEYVYTNWMTSDLSYEEKLDFSKVLNKEDITLDVSVWASILTNLTSKINDVVVFPWDDLYSKLEVLKTIDLLKNIYSKVWKLEEYNKILIKNDYDFKTYSLDELWNLIKNDIKNYLINDEEFSYFKDCQTSYYFKSCADFNLSKKYLLLNMQIPWVDNQKILQKYKENLLNFKKDVNYTDEITNYLPIALYKDKDFINNYFKFSWENFSNEDKINYIKVYDLAWISNDKAIKFYKDLKNSILIDARSSFLPDVYWNWANLTAKMLQLTLKNNETNDFYTLNLAKFLVQNLFETNRYYYSNNNEILAWISDYIDKKENISNLNFDFKTYFNNSQILTWTFTQDNRFESIKQSFDLKNISANLAENSLWFEKNWNSKMYYDVWVWYYLNAKDIESREMWISVSRNYYDYDEYKNAYKKQCYNFWWFANCVYTKTANIDNITSTSKWKFVVWEVNITIDKTRNNVVLKDFIPSWFELLNTDFNTVSSEVKDISANNYYNWYDLKEYKYDWVYLYAKNLNPWTYTFKYVMQATNKWNFSVKPAFAQEIESPEIWWRNAWSEFEVR